MYKTPDSKQINARFSDFEKTTVDNFLLSFQKNTAVEYSNFRDLFLALIGKYAELEKEITDLVNRPTPQPDNSKFVEKIETQQATIDSLQAQLAEQSEAKPVEKLPESLAEKFTEINKELFPELGTLSELQILETLQEVVQMKDETPPAEPETVEIIKEVERPLADNELLVNIAVPQKQLLSEIAKWRFSHGHDRELKQPGDILRAIAFQPSPLVDYLDEYATGVPLSKLKELKRAKYGNNN